MVSTIVKIETRGERYLTTLYKKTDSPKIIFEFLRLFRTVSNSGKRTRLRLPHRLEVRRDVQVAPGGLDDVIDSKAFANFGQGHAGVLVDLKDAL